jgi:asparagine synthase (glutamine-hydrolysing)
MCGLAGIASRASIASRDWLIAGRDAMEHRGPDDAGLWWSADGRVGLAHRRLSIVDLTAGGHQPMVRGDLHIVYNGEIYNHPVLRAELAAKGHSFSSASDTEVILAAYREWGADCLPKLSGMFAIALFDAAQSRLLLARDRAGEKPLYYHEAEGAIRFASELKALFADPALARRLDAEAFDSYLADGFVPPERSMIAGIGKLPPAHALEFDLERGTSRRWRYWSLPAPPDESAAADEHALLEELERLCAVAVKRQLVADVPVGVLLSGGVDSSLVTALAARAHPGVSSFTVRFPGFEGYDETEHARLIARHFGTTHVEVDAESLSPSLLPLLARQFDEPMTDSSMLPTYLLSKVVRRHCKVALGGDGGDELFGGYPHYDRMAWLARRAGPGPLFLRRLLAGAAGALPVGLKGRNWLLAAGCDFRRDVPAIAQMFDAAARRRLRGAGGWRAGFAESDRATRIPQAADLLQRATRLDFSTYLPEDLLVKVDRATMLNSLEVRAPLLDVDLIEFAFGRVPVRLKARPGARKILLKRLAARLLPPVFDQGRKQGFSVPLTTWLRHGIWRDFFREVLLDSSQRWFDRTHVSGLLANESDRRVNAERLFGLVMFELWRREYRVDMGVA